MTFEEWLSFEEYALSKNEPHYYLVREAWEAAFAEGYRHAILDELVDIAEKCKVE